jgi:hypothetical protein
MTVVARSMAVLACALVIVALSPARAMAQCGPIRYQAGGAPADDAAQDDEAPPAGDAESPGAAAATDDCTSAAVAGTAAVGAVAVSAVFVKAFANYRRGAISAQDLSGLTAGQVRGREDLALTRTAVTVRHMAEHPVVLHQRQTALGNTATAPQIDIPKPYLPAVTAGLEAYVRAFAAFEELALRQAAWFQRAVAAGGAPTIAGKRGPTQFGVVVAQPADVAKYASSINHQLPPVPPHRAFLDNALGGPGMWYASHAEKQHLYLFRGEPTGITLPMCFDCYDFFMAAAQNDPTITAPLVTVDPNMIRIFPGTGDVEGFWHNGLRAPDTTPAFVDQMRAKGLVP